MKKSTKENLIERIQSLYNNDFSFNKLIYNGMSQKSEFTCNKHELNFIQTPTKLLSGRKGCPKCNGTYLHNLNGFIMRGSETHDKKYLYSKFEYVNENTKSIIICPIDNHGEYKIDPSHHILRKQGCPKCATEKQSESRKYTNLEFKIEANLVYNGEYGYQFVDYKSCYEPIWIWCNVHAEKFLQKPFVHLQGHGCPKCGRDKLQTLFSDTREELITKCNLKYGLEKYDYQYVSFEYKNSKEKIKIKCLTCSHMFWQVASNHLQGSGCPKCNKRYIMTSKEYIEKCQKVHFDKNNNYEKTIFTKLNNYIIYTCGICANDIKQNAQSHLMGNGCGKCSGRGIGNNSIETYIRKAEKVFGGRYTYEELKKIPRDKSYIYPNCKKHGIFKIRAGKHLQRQGCPKCKESHGERFCRIFLENNNINYDAEFKITVTKKFPLEKKRKVRVDFAIIKNELPIALLEFDGKQHRESVQFGNQTKEEAESEFVLQQARDTWVNAHADRSNLPLIRINSDLYNTQESVNKYLTEQFKLLGLI